MIVSVLNFVLLLAVFLVINRDKPKLFLKEKKDVIKYTFLFILSCCAIFTINFFMVKYVRSYYVDDLSNDMIIAKSYLLINVLLVVYLQHTDFIKKYDLLFPIVLASFSFFILLYDIFMLFGISASMLRTMGVLFVIIPLVTDILIIYRLHKRSRRSIIFCSKSRIIETLIIMAMKVIVTEFYLMYFIFLSPSFLVVLEVTFLIFMEVMFILRVLYEEPKFISKLDKEEIPYRLPIYEKSSVMEYDLSVPLQSRLCLLFETEKPYLSPDISIGEVAEKLYTNKTYLSKVLNVNMDRNFREFVNHHRVMEAMKLFSKNTSLSLNDLCTMCGFRNIASFTNAFRLHAGKTPGEWCRSIKNGGEESGKSYFNG